MKKYLAFIFAIVFILTNGMIVFSASAEETLPTNEDIINETVSAEIITGPEKEPIVEENQEESLTDVKSATKLSAISSMLAHKDKAEGKVVDRAAIDARNAEIIAEFEKNSSVKVPEDDDVYGEDWEVSIESVEDPSLETETNADSRATAVDEKVQNVTLNYKVTSEQPADFIEMFNRNDVLTAEEATAVKNGRYYGVGLQGGCTDGTYFYYAFGVVDPDSTDVDTRIICASQLANGTFDVIKRSDGLMNIIHHAGDMTYNKNTDQVIICTSATGHHQRIYSISADKLRSGATASDFMVHHTSCMVTSIDYNEMRNQYVVGVTKNNDYYAILDSDFNLISTVGATGRPDYDTGWERQGIYCDENYIYSLLWYANKDSEGNIEGPVRTNAQGKNKLRIHKWDGTIVKTLYFSLDAATSNGADIYIESENMVVNNGEIYIGYFCESRPFRKICYHNLSKVSFYIQYCPDTNIASHPNNSTNRKAFVIRGISTPLYTNRYSNTGYTFAGWMAYRREVDKWYYKSADGSTRDWYKEGDQPAGYTKYVYSENQNVSQTGALGDHVLMCPVWNATNYFYVDFLSNGGSGTMSRKAVLHGTATSLTANAFSKTVGGNTRTFQGWHAYWKERNMWYYENTAIDATGWYQEDCQPYGYTKYVYTNGQTVARTAWKGGHIQMHALWDEFYIQYNAIDAIINPGYELEMQTAWYKSGNTNLLQKFNKDYGFNTNSPKVFDEWTGWFLYRREIDKWYFQDGTWYNYDTGTSMGYARYVKAYDHETDGPMYLGGTARPGEHLVLQAKWS